MKKGIVYRIEYNQNPEIRYIGSNLQPLKYRWRDHKDNFKKWKRGMRVGCSSSVTPYFEQYGIENFRITPIKTYEVADKQCLHAYETLWISKLKCINTQLPFNPLFKNKAFMKQYKKNYKEVNKEHLKQKDKDWAENNKEKIRQKNKEYEKTDKRKAYKKEQGKEYRSKTMICECGVEIRLGAKYNHLKSKKHRAFLESQ
jgi:hypothetical protein